MKKQELIDYAKAHPTLVKQGITAAVIVYGVVAFVGVTTLINLFELGIVLAGINLMNEWFGEKEEEE